MITKEQKLRLGTFLIISVVLLIGILAIFIVPKLSREGDTYFINFKGTSVNGVNEGSDVKYQGVKIGSVSVLEVNPKNLDSVLIYVQIKKGFPVKKDMRAALQYAGITGLRFVEISGGKAESEFVPPGGEILPKKGLGEKAEDIVLNVDSVVDAVNKILNPENQEKIASMLKNLEKSTRVISDVLEKREKDFGNSIKKFDTAMTQIVRLSENLKEFSDYLIELKEKVPVEKIAKESEKLIKTVSQRFSDQEMGKVLGKFDTFLETATVSIKRIENRFHDMEGGFNKTLSGLKESMENISKFTRELAEDPTIFIRKRAEKRSKR